MSEQSRQLSLHALWTGPRAIVAALAVFAALCISPVLRAQEVGPLPAAPPHDDGPIPETSSYPSSNAHPARTAPAARADSEHYSSPLSNEPPALPVDQIVQTFADHEAEFREERDNFTYVQDFVVQTIDDSGQVDGEYHMTSDIIFTPSGKRYEQITYAPLPTLERISLSEQDLDDLKNIQPFVLTTEELPKYDIRYVGRQKVDEIGTYVFDVGPKKIEKNQRYFQGRIWVDDRDLEIVKTYGKAVPDIRKGNNENVFPRFETFRQNIEGHYWFPTYTHSDDILHFRSGDVHIRMTVHYSQYKRFRVTVRLVRPDSPTQAQPQPSH